MKKILNEIRAWSHMILAYIVIIYLVLAETQFQKVISIIFVFVFVGLFISIKFEISLPKIIKSLKWRGRAYLK